MRYLDGLKIREKANRIDETRAGKACYAGEYCAFFVWRKEGKRKIMGIYAVRGRERPHAFGVSNRRLF